MADTEAFPIDDIIAMADQSGYTLSELRSPTFTDPLLDAKMREFYAGTLGQVVNPGQGTREPDVVFMETLKSGVTEDVTKIGQGIAQAARDLGSGLPAAAKQLTSLIRNAPILLLGAAGVYFVLISRKVI